MIQTKISIVTVVYNGAQIIEETIISVVNQTYQNIEYIIIDGGSFDGTQEIIKKYEEKISYWISEKDNGIYHAMNKGIEVASGNYIIFMNAGDQFYEKETISHVFKETINYDLIYGNTLLNTDGKKSLSRAKSFEKINYGMPFCHQSVFVKQELMKQYNFSLNYKLASDYNFFLTLYNQNKYSFKRTDEIISIYDNCGASMSLDTIREKLKIIKKHYSFSRPFVFYFCQLKYYTFTSLLKKKLPHSLVVTLIKLKRKI